MPLSILLVDDHAGFRQAIGDHLRARGLTVVGEAADGGEAVQLARNLQPDIAVLDLNMPILNGIDAGLAMRTAAPSTKTILLTMHHEDEYVQQASGAGFAGYVLKSRAAFDLVEAIREVERGGTYLSPCISHAAFPPDPQI
ncbi:MAG: response regulator transcription factor [Acidobacteriia bacterium]|nr:response regulator transcription factor [Terriglobia bacterium]